MSEGEYVWVQVSEGEYMGMKVSEGEMSEGE